MGIELNYKVFGEGEPVIILHGLFGMLDNWQTFAKQLAKDYMVFIIDQRDHGKSPHTDDFSYPILAEDLLQFMNANWIYNARIIGHSMGGKTAMQFAADNSDMIEQLVVVDIAPAAYKDGHAKIFEALFAVDVENIESRKEVEKILSVHISELGVRQFLMKNLQRIKEGGYRWKMNLDLLYREYTNIIANVTEQQVEVPTLFVKGENSNYITDAAINRINTLYTDVEIETVKNAGHWVHAEQPATLQKIVSSFFAKK